MRDYESVLIDLPENFIDEVTWHIPVGAELRVDFVIFDGADEELGKLEFRTYNSDVKNIPLKFRGLKQKCFIRENAKIDKIIKNAISKKDGYAFVSVEINYCHYKRGWVRLSDLMKQNIFGNKK